MVAHAVETGTIVCVSSATGAPARVNSSLSVQAKDVPLAEVQEILDALADDFACQIKPCKAWVAKEWHALSRAQRFAVWNALETGLDKLWQAAEQDHGHPSSAALRFYTVRDYLPHCCCMQRILSLICRAADSRNPQNSGAYLKRSTTYLYPFQILQPPEVH